MNNKKKVTYAVSILLASVFGSVFLKKKNQLTVNEDKIDEIARIFVGEYWFLDDSKQTQHTLKIDNQLRLWVDDKFVEGQWMHLTQEEIAFQDHFGYHILINAKDHHVNSLYDEADNQTFQLIKKTLA